MHTPGGQQHAKARFEGFGPIDELGADEMRRRFQELDLSATKEIVLDFRGVSLINASGIGELIGVYKKLALQGGRVRIDNLPREMYSVFKVVNMDKLFSIFPAA
jgi:anti-anti-sigma factor